MYVIILSIFFLKRGLFYKSETKRSLITSNRYQENSVGGFTLKRRIIFFFLVLAIFIGGWYFVTGNQGSLSAAISSSKQVEDFILHVRVEETDNGIRVLQSLQYVGKEEIVIEHQTPLVSVSFLHDNHDYTGSSVSKVLNEGNIYPQKIVSFPSPEKGECNLYVNARFNVGNERFLIEHVEELLFE